jgi:hypothetical protein
MIRLLVRSGIVRLDRPHGDKALDITMNRWMSVITLCGAAGFAFGPLAAQDPPSGDPIGWEFLKSEPGASHLMGLRLHTATLAAGILEVGTSTLFAPAVNFDSVLVSGEKYLIEFNTGASAGEVLEIQSFALNTLIVSQPLPVESNVEFRVRRIPRLSEVIPATLAMGTADFNPDHADLVLLPEDGGGIRQYYVSTYFNPAHPEYQNRYINATTGLPEDPHLIYTRGFFYLRRGATDLNHWISSAVKTGGDTWLSVNDVFNYFSSVYPVGMTLGNSGLSASLQAGTAETADVVWMTDEAGVWRKYFQSNGTAPLTAGWRAVDAPAGLENEDHSGVPLSAGFAIHRRAAAPYRVRLLKPGFYSPP